MDEALAYALYHQDLYGVTAKVETRFRAPIPVGAKLIIRAWTLEQRRNLVDARAEIRLQAEGDPLVAEASATMYLQELESPSEPRP
jgi:acyl-coenzyme A thioesterase PaaI-like protein